MEEPTTSLTDLSVTDLLGRLSSRDPVPGGGSAAALAGALGAALVSMVVELSAGRPDAAEHEGRLGEIGARAAEERDGLASLAQQDADAYQSVIVARRLPRATDEQQASRLAALNRAIVLAAEVPLRTARSSARVLELAAAVAPIGNRNAVSDAGVAALLAAAAMRSAALNVRINLPYLPAGEPLAGQATDELVRLEALADELEREALLSVRRRMDGS